MTTTSWGLGVVAASDGDRWSTVTIQPPDDAEHAELAVRLKAAGLKRLNLREWNGGLWPLSRCSLTIQSGHLTQLHTGRSRIVCSEPLEVSPAWQEAAARGRALLSLVPPGTMPEDHDHAAAAAETGEDARLVDAVTSGVLLGGLAEVRTTAEPYGRRW
ncbi:hypothetical protein ACIQ9Q_29645 [Streptomyces sp. NPDC094438]|uniref:hypothetical protein n=1 Tax=Streptomyces sp. NPDC094438 TaxID=3366061 RepID=UPI0038124795